MTNDSKLSKKQVKVFEKIVTVRDGDGSPIGGEGTYRVKVEVRFDDECNNGHNTFAITADVHEKTRSGGYRWYSGGCQHELIAFHFPELAQYIKWHLCSTDGPLHYIANTIYHAGDRDHWGKRAGEPYRYSTHIQFGNNPIKHKLPQKFVAFLQESAPYDFEVISITHAREPQTFTPKYTFGGYADKWHECPFDTETEALDFLKALQTCEPRFISVPTTWGEGKARDLDAARNAAIWPDATDEQLSAEPDELKRMLTERLPALLAEFRQAIESLGFTW
jgi:hypothetical protein